MFSRIIKSYNYNRWAVESSVPLVGIGAGIGGSYYLVKSKDARPLSEHIIGAAFYTGMGGVLGLVSALAHPLLFTGCLFGVPAYLLQGAQSKRSN